MDSEELLWELAGLEAEVDRGGAAGIGSELPESALAVYRSGRMPGPESDRVEAALIASGNERRRLEALAGVRIPAPASVRRRLFGDASGAVEVRSRGGWRRPRWRLLAAAAVGVLAVVGLWQAGERGLLPGIRRGVATRPVLPAYHVSLVGTAALRSLPEGSTGGGQTGVSETRPETVVEISVLPETAPSSPVTFGLYRRVEGKGRLRRVPDAEIDTLEENRGAARIRLRASSLVGEAPGTRSFFIVVTEPGALRDELSVTDASSEAEALQAACGGRVYERTLTIGGREPGSKTP
jgi:hypothetical protein